MVKFGGKEENSEDFLDPETPFGEKKRLSSQMAKQYSPTAVVCMVGEIWVLCCRCEELQTPLCYRLATSKRDWCPPYRPCPYCCCRGYDYSLAENVWIQYLVGSWYGPYWDCNTGCCGKEDNA